MARSTTGSQTLATSGDAQKLPIQALDSNYLFVAQAQGPITVDLYKGNTLFQSHNLKRFGLLKNRDYDRAVVCNAHTSGNTIEIYFGQGEYDPGQDGAKVEVEAYTNDPDVKANVAGGAVSVPDVECPSGATTKIADGAANNLRVSATNPEGSGETLRMGLLNTTGAANGQPVPEGATMSFETTTDVYVYNPGAASIFVAVFVETAS